MNTWIQTSYTNIQICLQNLFSYQNHAGLEIFVLAHSETIAGTRWWVGYICG